MNKSIILIVAAAFLCAGCDKLPQTESAKKKKIADQELATEAQAKLAARLAGGGGDGTAKTVGKGPVKVTVKAAANAGNGGAALVVMLCSSPKLMEDVEGELYLIEALSGEGGDRNELKRQTQEFRKNYRPVLEKGLAARGSTFEEFLAYALGQAVGQKQQLKVLIGAHCPRGDKELVERTARGLMKCFSSPEQE